MKRILLLLLLLPSPGFAQEETEQEPPQTRTHGFGVLCPRTNLPATFYKESNLQDAAGTIAFQSPATFTVTSDSFKNFAATGAQVMESTCDGNMTGIRIDAKRDGWLQAGTIIFPPAVEWDYADWSAYLLKSAVWKPVMPITLYQGNMQMPYKDKPYAEAIAEGEIYPLKFSDDNNYALVVVDEGDSFDATCKGKPVPPSGKMAWMIINRDDGRPVAVPAHPKGC